MTVMTHEPSTDTPLRGGVVSRLLVPEFWATVSIVAMWLAVLFDGVFGSDMTFSNPPHVTVLPSSAALALFAAIATCAVAKRGFRRGDNR